MRSWGIWYSPPFSNGAPGSWCTDTSGLIISTHNRGVARAILTRTPGPNRSVREFGPDGLPIPLDQELPA